MPKPQLAPGVLGRVSYSRLSSGQVQARARVRDDAGTLRLVKRTGASEAEALAALTRHAGELSAGVEELLHPGSTLAEACRVWLIALEASGSVEPTTLDAYEQSARATVLLYSGGIPLRDLTVGRCDRIIQKILAEKSISAARKARSVMSLVCGFAVRQDAMDRNPIRDVQRLPSSPKKESYLEPAQIAFVRDRMAAWPATRRHGPKPNAQLLADGMDIMLGTSARIGEVIALTRADVDITAAEPSLLIAATDQWSTRKGRVRKDAPKRSRQKRRVALPGFAAAAVRRRLTHTGPAQDAPLFGTASGLPMSVSNFERLLRSFVLDNALALRDAGITVDEFSTHLFRRTAATLVERAAGIGLASRLLGHASEQITRASYIVTAERVDPSTAVILDELLG